MLKSWDLEPDKWSKKVFCEDCDIELTDHFAECPKCHSIAYHISKYTEKENISSEQECSDKPKGL